MKLVYQKLSQIWPGLISQVSNHRETLIALLITLIPLGFAISPYFHDGFFPTMDDVQVVRIEEMYKELISGQFPVRIAGDLGNSAGYMLFNFYSPLVYYLGAIFHILGFTLVISTKLTFICAFLVGWLGIFILLRSRFSIIPTISGTTIFLASSYMGYDSFQRGALGEFFAMCLLPWLIYFSSKATQEKNLIASAGLTLSVALLIITHNLTTLMALPFIYLIAVFLNPKKLLKTTLLITLGVIISSFYWLPALIEKQYIVINKIDFIVLTYKTHLLTILELSGINKPEWGFLPPMLGISIFIGSIGSLVLLFFSYKKHFQSHRIILLSAFGFLFSMFFASNISRPLWDSFAFIVSYIQFPWRFLTLSTVFAVILCTYLISTFKKPNLQILLGLVIIIPLYTVHSIYLRPTQYIYVGKYTADDPCGTAGWSNEYLTIWTKECLPKDNKLDKVNIIDGDVEIKSIQVVNSHEYKIQTKGHGQIFINKYYFPGWKAYLNNRENLIQPFSSNGLIATQVTAGENELVIKYEGTQTQKVANLISLFGIILGTLILVKSFVSRLRSANINSKI